MSWFNLRLVEQWLHIILQYTHDGFNECLPKATLDTLSDPRWSMQYLDTGARMPSRATDTEMHPETPLPHFRATPSIERWSLGLCDTLSIKPIVDCPSSMHHAPPELERLVGIQCRLLSWVHTRRTVYRHVCDQPWPHSWARGGQFLNRVEQWLFPKV